MHLLKNQGISVNRSTVYRILNKLIDSNNIRSFTIHTGSTYFEPIHKCSTPHHHFFCSDCESVFCLSSTLVDTESLNLKKLLPSNTFKVHHHNFNLVGTCGECLS